MALEASAACPVCLAEFPPPRDGPAFALHVAQCTAPPPSASSSRSSLSAAGGARKTAAPGPPPPPAMRSCPMCQHVYARGTLPHEISFHEHECARVNARPRDKPAAASNKRAREAAAPASAAAEEEEEEEEGAPAVKLFPSECFLCGAGGRSLLRCEGACARVFHLNCVEDLQAAVAASAGAEGGNSARRAQQQHWTCAECFRGLHRCRLCGFLGSDAKDLVRCAVADCGRYFHRACLAEGEAVEYVCPRHTCAKCGAMETDMTRCLSCSKCHTATHLRCRPGAATTHAADASPHVTALPTPAASAAGANANLHVCALCAVDRPTVKPSTHLGNALRQRCANGDVVLILEYSNALLPASARAAAPGVYNQWGVVTSVESMEPAAAGNQLLSVSVFSDDSHIVVPNRYVLRVASANSFATPTAMVRELIKWHAMTELNLRESESEQTAATRRAVAESSCKAFAARLDALAIPTADALAQASEGDAALKRFERQDTPRQYREESVAAADFAPVYLFLDTRPGKSTAVNRAGTTKQPSHQPSSAGTPPPNDDDVDMDQGEEETKTEENADQSTGSGAGSGAGSSPTKTGRANDEADHEAGEGADATSVVDDDQAWGYEHDQEPEPTEATQSEHNAAGERSEGDAARGPEAVASAADNGESVGAEDASVHEAETEGDDHTSEDTPRVPTNESEDVVMDPEERALDDAGELSTASITVVDVQTVVAETPAESPAEAGAATSESVTSVTIELEAEVMANSPLVKKAAKEETETEIDSIGSAPDATFKETKSATVDGAEGPADKDILINSAADLAMPFPKKRVSPSEEEAPPSKRAKVFPDVSKPSQGLPIAASKFEPLPAVSTFNITQVIPTFTPQHHFEKPAPAGYAPGGGAHAEPQRKLTRKEAVLAEYPPALIGELERDVGYYLEHGNAGVQHEHRLPKDADSFPWAAHAALFRPAFYRPSVVLNRARGGRRVDSVSRLLVSQDKRNLKCFIQSAQQAPLECPSTSGNAASHHAYLVVDLVSLESFAQLMAAVRTKLLVALEDLPRFTQDLFQMEPRAALHWLEQQQSRKPSEQQLGMTLWYCCFDGSRKTIALDQKPSRKALSDWLCFCANACHLTLALSIPPVDTQPVSNGITRATASAVSVRGS